MDALGCPRGVFHWTVDVLAGALVHVRHDTSTQERLAKLKNSWEEASEGRWGKASAAVSYYNAKGNALAAASNPPAEAAAGGGAEAETVASADTPGPGYALPETAVPDLAEALGVEAVEALSAREALIARLTLSEVYREDDKTSPEVVLTAEEKKQRTEAHAAALLSRDEAAKQVVADVNMLTDKARAALNQRVGILIAAAGSRNEEFGQMWGAREACRTDRAAKNAALRSMLERAEEAVAELDPDAAKGKKGKKK